MTTVRKRWQFGWCDEDSPPTNGDSHDWRSKTFRAGTFDRAMDKMMAFVRGKPFVCIVDYECRAVHVPYHEDSHESAFPRIDRTEHELRHHLS